MNRSSPAHHSYQNQTQGNEISRADHLKRRFLSACRSQGFRKQSYMWARFWLYETPGDFFPCEKHTVLETTSLNEADQTEMVWIPPPKLLPVSCMIPVLIYNEFSSELLCPTSAKHLGRCVPPICFQAETKTRRFAKPWPQALSLNSSPWKWRHCFLLDTLWKAW